MSSQIPRVPQLSSFFAIVLTLVALAGCGGDGNGDKAKAPGDTTASTSAPSAPALAILATADAADGTTDKIISKCVTCNLGMEGSAEHVTKLGDYAVHLCSEECKQKFDEGPEKALLSMKLPK